MSVYRSSAAIASSSRRSRNNTTAAHAQVAATAMRRLSDTDVRTIFECLHSPNNLLPPANLHFSIVPVGPTGLKLSPPSYEFADGLYVLLRPAKTNQRAPRNSDVPRAPEHLQHLIVDSVLSETCPWSLSGPQFPQPTAIQQRYCYPKGRPEYSSHKGGALWTMYGPDGQEDVEFRLLHVYFSAKRAINKGVSSVRPVNNEPVPYPESESSPPKKRAATKGLQSSPLRALPNEQQNLFMNSLAITMNSLNRSSLCGSPLYLDIVPPYSVFPSSAANTTSSLDKSNTSSSVYPTVPEQLRTTSINDILLQPQAKLQGQMFNHEDSSDDSSRMGLPQIPFRRLIQTPAPIVNVAKSPLLLSTGDYTVTLPGNDDYFNDTDSVSSPFPCEILDSPLQQEIDSFWNDPVMTIMLQASQDAAGDHSGAEQREHSLTSRLNVLQESIRDLILATPESEQPKLVSLMVSWARKVAEDPLASSTPPAAAAATDDDSLGGPTMTPILTMSDSSWDLSFADPTSIT